MLVSRRHPGLRVARFTRQASPATAGVGVNAIVPGWFDTEMTDGLFSNEKSAGWVPKLTRPMLVRHASLNASPSSTRTGSP